MTNRKHHAGLARSVDRAFGGPGGQREGLLDKDTLAGFCAGDDLFCMQRVRRRYHDTVDVCIFEHGPQRTDNDNATLGRDRCKTVRIPAHCSGKVSLGAPTLNGIDQANSPTPHADNGEIQHRLYIRRRSPSLCGLAIFKVKSVLQFGSSK